MNTQLRADTAGKWWTRLFNIECNGCSSQVTLPEYDLGTIWLYHVLSLLYIIILLYHVMSFAFLSSFVCIQTLQSPSNLFEPAFLETPIVIGFLFKGESTGNHRFSHWICFFYRNMSLEPIHWNSHGAFSPCAMAPVPRPWWNPGFRGLNQPLSQKWGICQWHGKGYPLVICYIAIENDHL